MQASDDTALAAAVASADRTPVRRLVVDWNRDNGFNHALSDLTPVVDSVTIERSITSDLPAECTLIEGYATATLTANLAGTRPGDPRDIARMMSPYRADSPLESVASVDVAVQSDLGLVTTDGPRLLRQFTGTTRSVRLSASSRTVTIDALDPAERLRAAVTLPVAAAEERDFRDIPRFFYKDQINTQWIVDFVLRRNGIYLSPPPRPGCIWAMTCHGSLHPDIGSRRRLATGNKTSAEVPEFVPGVYGLAANGGPQIRSYIESATAGKGFRFGAAGVGHVFDFLIKAGGSNTFHPYVYTPMIVHAATYWDKDQGAIVEIEITATGQLRAHILNDTTAIDPVLIVTLNGPVITGPAAWHSVGNRVAYNATTKQITSRWHLDGAQTTTVTTAATVPSLVTTTRGRVLLQTCLPLQCVQISEAPAPPADWGVPHTPQCDLDIGLNWFTGLPDIIGADSWSVIKEAVAAEYGLVTFTEHGRFRFLNRDTARAPTIPAKVVTAATDLSALDVTTSVDSVRNEITIRTAVRLDRGDYHNVYATKSVYELETQAFTTRTYTLPTDERCHVLTNAYRWTKAEWTAEKVGGHVAVNANTGAEVTNVTVTIEPVDTQDAARVTVTNPNTFPIRFAVDSQPAFHVRGKTIADDPTRTTTITDPTSISRFGRRSLALPDNPFRQHAEPAAAIAASLLADLKEPAPILAEVPIVGDPRLQLADHVALDDPDGLGGPITGSVIALRRTLNADDGLADSITLRTRPRT